jgi:hypothetical protein
MTVEKPRLGALAEALERANAIRPMLSAATDELNKAIEEAEQTIAALQLGVRASVNLYSDEGGTGWYQDLVFGKEAKSWRLLVETGDASERSEITPLVNASREIRLDAVERFPALVSRLFQVAEEEIHRVQERTATARKFTQSIGGGTTK